MVTLLALSLVAGSPLCVLTESNLGAVLSLLGGLGVCWISGKIRDEEGTGTIEV